jgi:hypothetical protein
MVKGISLDFSPFTVHFLRAKRLHIFLIDIAPLPILARFKRLDNRMVGSLKVLGCVLVFGAIAAANMAASKA